MHWPAVLEDYISIDRPFLGITLAYNLHLVPVKKGFLKVQQWGPGWESGVLPKGSLCVSCIRCIIRGGKRAERLLRKASPSPTVRKLQELLSLWLNVLQVGQRIVRLLSSWHSVLVQRSLLFWQSTQRTDSSEWPSPAQFQAGSDLPLPEHQEHVGIFHHCLVCWIYSGVPEEAAKGDKVRRKTIALPLCLSSCQPALSPQIEEDSTIASIPDSPTRQVSSGRRRRSKMKP